MMEKNRLSLKDKLYEIVFGTDTFAGKFFDIVLIVLIIASVLCIMLDSVPSYGKNFAKLFKILEWIFTIFFTLEYLTRIYISKNRLKYIKSFFGIVDLVSFLPTYLSIFIVNSHYLLVIRTLRLLRIFRILKLVQYLNQAEILIVALKNSRNKIIVFLFTVTNLVIIIGSLMYVIEGEPNGFTSIPKSIYWAVVTLTTVGYGDISPKTPLGQFLASVIMIVGYSIIAVPTGIVTHEITQMSKKVTCDKTCPKCGYIDKEEDSRFCRKCGAELMQVKS
jgi:voltage-gated potassium channel